MAEFDIVDLSDNSHPNFDNLTADPVLGIREVIDWYCQRQELVDEISAREREQLRDLVVAYLGHRGISLNPQAQPEWPTELARDIFTRLWPEWAEMFYIKNSGYGETHGMLGLRGCFPDLWRKVHRLKDALWDGADTSGWSEQPREILLDLVGHCFMIVSLLDGQATEDYAQREEQAGGAPLIDFRLNRGTPVRMTVRSDDWEAMPEGMQQAVRDLAGWLGERDAQAQR